MQNSVKQMQIKIGKGDYDENNENGKKTMSHIRYYKKIEKQSDNPYLNLYHIDAIDCEEIVFDYYFATRRTEENLRLKTLDEIPEGIVIYAVTEEETSRLVVIREYRYPIGDYIYALPAGLIDGGESAGEAATREMLEETGYRFVEYTEGGLGI